MNGPDYTTAHTNKKSIALSRCLSRSLALSLARALSLAQTRTRARTHTSAVSLSRARAHTHTHTHTRSLGITYSRSLARLLSLSHKLSLWSRARACGTSLAGRVLKNRGRPGARCVYIIYFLFLLCVSHHTSVCMRGSSCIFVVWYVYESTHSI